MTAYYNENNPWLADWLQNLIAAGHIAKGVVDRRDVADVKPADLRGFTQVHLFAGIGGWSLALRRANWSDRRPIWTVSCPCQPWSRARVIWYAQSAAKKDSRDLWPAVMPLVTTMRPLHILGEQVCGGKAQAWIQRTQRDLEKAGYRFEGEERRASDFGAATKRKRFYFSAIVKRARGNGLVTSLHLGTTRSVRWRGQEDLRAITKAPFKPTNRWPQPLLRSGDARVSNRMASLRAYGNAIDPWIAAQFIVDVHAG